MEGLSIRAATRRDFDRIAAIIDDPPSRQSLAIAGDERRARAAGRLFVRNELSIQLQHTVVAEIDGVVVGVMDAGVARRDIEASPAMYMRLLVSVLRAVGPPALLRFIRSRAAWNRVAFAQAGTDYYIAELDVAAAHRNRGVGAALLQHAEAEARRLSCPRMSLSTNVDNPAQHLYERSGFRIVETKLDADYEKLGGSPGRVFMVRDLTGDASTP